MYILVIVVCSLKLELEVGAQNFNDVMEVTGNLEGLKIEENVS